MATWVRGFVIADVALVHAAFTRAILAAERAEIQFRGTPLAVGAAATVIEFRLAYNAYNNGLRDAAVKGAVEAVAGMRQRLKDTQVRPDTGTSPSLSSVLRAQPLSSGTIQTGAVGVGSIAWLERAINPRTPGYGSYWRAQEYGTGNRDDRTGIEVPSQTGRILFGYFAGAGLSDMTPPQAQYAGGGGPHPIFVSTTSGSFSGPRGGSGGPGTISHEIRPRRFIGFGADEAAVRWRARIAALEDEAIQKISAISVP